MRIVLISFLLLSHFLIASSDAQESSIQAPAGLTSTTYSSTAVELFWSRVDGAVSYTIARDGQMLDSTNGISFFEQGLDPVTEYQYSVRSVDENGEQSTESVINVSTRFGMPDTDRTRPQSLRADVYSSTALELFWRFTPSPSLYEITRDGIVIAITGGRSFFEEGLTPNTQYQYTVTLLNSDSPSASITSTTRRDGNDDNDSIPNSDEPILNNARLVVYSDTAGEVLWDRPSAASGITRIEVLRNRESLGRFSSTSFFDDARVPGVQYDYTLIALDNSGSELGRITLDENDALGPESIEFLSPILARNNVVDIVNLVFSAFSGQAFANQIVNLPYHSDPTYFSRNLAGRPESDSVAATEVCDNGGAASFTPIHSDFPLFSELAEDGWDFEFSDCLDGPTLIDGSFTRLVSTSAFSVDSPTGIRAERGGNEIQFSGFMSRSFEGPTPTFDREIIAESMNAKVTRNNETFELIDANFHYFLQLPLIANMEGSFQIRSPLTQNRLLDVEILEPFSWTGSSANSPGFMGNWVRFTSGTMLISAEDGTALFIEPHPSAISILIDARSDVDGGAFGLGWNGFIDPINVFVIGFVSGF